MKQIGVVIPVYNGSKTIEKSIKSLLNQTYKDWVAIIINDGSTDDTKEILDRYNSDDRFYITHFEQNRGRSYARQTGLEIVRELKLKYMCMLDADDWYYPNKLKFQFGMMEDNSNLTLISSAIGVTNRNSELSKVIRPSLEQITVNYNKYKEFVQIPHASSIIRIKDISNQLKYDEDLSFGEDQDFLRRLLINKVYAFDPKIQYIYNREDSFSFAKFKGSMKSSIISYNKLPLKEKDKIYHYIKCKLKIVIVFLLLRISMIDRYFKKIGKSPTREDLKEFSKNFITCLCLVPNLIN